MVKDIFSSPLSSLCLGRCRLTLRSMRVKCGIGCYGNPSPSRYSGRESDIYIRYRRDELNFFNEKKRN